MIGKVPDGWRIEPLKDNVIIQNGYAFKSKEFKNDGIPVVRITNVGDGKLDISKVVYYEENDNLKNFLVYKNDILMSLTGDDKNLKICVNQYDKKMYLNQRVAKFNVKDTLIQKYLFYTLQEKSSALLNQAKGIAQKNISVENLNTLQIPIPPLPQQEKIVKVLDISSALIEKQKELIEKYDLFLKSKFIEMFGDPILNPMGWEVEKLGNVIVDVKNGLTRRSNDTTGEAVLKLKDIRKNYVRFETLNRIQLDEKEKEKFIVEKGDLLFIRVNGNPDYVGRCAVFHGYTEAIYFNDHIMRIKVNKEKYHSVFLGYIVNSPYGKKQILKYRKTSAGQHTISQDGLERLSFYLPPIELQNKFASIVEKIETLKEQESQKLNHLETLHNSLMDKAFKGEIQ